MQFLKETSFRLALLKQIPVKFNPSKERGPFLVKSIKNFNNVLRNSFVFLEVLELAYNLGRSMMLVHSNNLSSLENVTSKNFGYSKIVFLNLAPVKSHLYAQIFLRLQFLKLIFLYLFVDLVVFEDHYKV